jgi:hypothetical protein
MVVVSDMSDRYLELAIQYFKRAEQEANPQRKAKFRELAGEYRDKAVEMLDRALIRSTKADA